MRTKSLMMTLLLIAGLMLAACTPATADDDADDATETPTEAVADDSADDLTDAADDDASNDVVIPPDQEFPDQDQDMDPIVPDEMLLVGPNNEQAGYPRSYFWASLDEFLAMELFGRYIPLQEEPLELESGDEVTMVNEREERFPDEGITVQIFPREGNFDDVQSTRLGDREAWFNHTDPLDEFEVDPSDPTWVFDLEPGEYFVLIDTHWPTPETYPRDLWVEYGYWIVVN